MIENKKFAGLTFIFVLFLCISSAFGEYIFAKSANKNVDGNASIADRQFPDIILKAGYENTSCIVQSGIDGSEVSLGDVKKFFVEDEDVTDLYGNHFVQLKKYYINMSQDSEGIITYNLSSTKLDDTYFLCPYFKDKDGNEIDYAYYGKYKGSVTDGKLCSKADATPASSTTIDDFRTYAKANGDQYHQTDWCAVFTAQIMFMCAYKTTKADDAITYRSSGTKTGGGEEVLGIEDIVGNKYECIDGVQFSPDSSNTSYNLKWANKISDYSDSISDDNKTEVKNLYGHNGYYIKKMNCVNGSSALSLFPNEFTNTSSSSASMYYCDRCYFYKSTLVTPRLSFWGAYGSNDANGLFFLGCDYAWTGTLGYVGSRLHTKELTTASVITLKAGYEDASCTVRDSSGNDVSQTDIQNFFVENLDVTDSNGNHFVKLKKYYVNMSQNTSGGDEDGVITYKLSHTKVDDTYFVCPYFYDKDGNEIEYAYYGKYKASVSNSKLCSVSNVTPTYYTYIDDFRTDARNNGEQYHQTDWCTVFTAQIMCMCFYKTTNLESYYTYRRYSASTGAGSQILGIEDIIGNGWEFVDGIQFRLDETTSKYYVGWHNFIGDYSINYISNNQTELQDLTVLTGYDYIKKMYCVNGSPALSLFPKEFSGSDGDTYSTKYYCDECVITKSSSDFNTKCLLWGAHFNIIYDGLFYLRGCENWTNYRSSFSGSRLHAKYLS